MATDLSIYEGEDKVWTVTITDSSGTPIDITGYTFLFTVKTNIDDTDTAAIIQKEITSHSDPTNGVTEITLIQSDTNNKDGKFLYDYQWLDTSDNKRVILKNADFEIEQRVGDEFS